MKININKLRHATGILTILTFLICCWNIGTSVGSLIGVYTFLYVGTFLAILSHAFIILCLYLPLSIRSSIMKQTLVVTLLVTSATIVFAIPSV